MRMKNSGKSTPISLRDYTERDSKRVAVVEMDGESNGSWTTEEVESPRSVAGRGGGGGKNMIHSQILRIIAEDSHIGEDVGEGHHFSHIIVFSRPVSPLSGRTIAN
ncbi:Hypothetical predicted protein [Olea europaea subsp. europaea]|uniref:Uncharacterized protein n=1 Tax=Olea europaea subsp. europaea TaxID=158383 RepID=A0A8S0UJZ3_OLEEU|nr:Hypothetical predicted protein [Olea europaea subsp. europaea]